MSHFSFELMNSSFAQEVIHKANATGACLFLFNNSLADEKAVTFLYQRRTPLDAIEAYRNGLFRYDSYLPHQDRSDLNAERGQRFIGTKVKRSQAGGPENYPSPRSNQRYWQTLGNFGYEQTASMIQRMSKHTYMVIGVHLESYRKSLMIDRALSSLENWIRESTDYVIEQSVCRYDDVITSGSLSTRKENTQVLTNREFQVACEVLKGKSNKEIAAALSLSDYTVDNHLRKIYRKLGIHNRTCLASVMNDMFH